MICIDPPSGWKYGFPKVWDKSQPIVDWLIDNGYPASIIEEMGNNFIIRCWHASEEDYQ